MTENNQQPQPYWTRWPRCFCHIDMVAFFASVEQLDFPELQNKPVVVINAEHATTIITTSYEARAFGIKTGMHLKEAESRCGDIVIRVARPARYAQLSHVIFLALKNHVSPDIEMFSIDEAFFDLKPVLKLHSSIEELADKIDKTVKVASRGLTSTIGISEGKLTAKLCGQLNKRKITIVPPNHIKSFLAPIEVKHICGIGPAMTQYLYQQGVKYCWQLAKKPMTILSNKWGNQGKRLYLVSQGHDPEPIRIERPVKSMGQSKILPPNTRDISVIKAIAHRLLDRLCQRIEDNHFTIDSLKIVVSGYDSTPSKTISVSQTACGSLTIWGKVRSFFNNLPPQGYHKVSLQAGALSPFAQADLLSEPSCDKTQKINQLKNTMRNHFGRDILHTADQLLSSHQPVISPSYRHQTDAQSVTQHAAVGIAESIQRVLIQSEEKPLEKIKYQLYKLGLNFDEVNAATDELTSDKDKLKLILKCKISNERLTYKNKQKILSALVKKGFDYQLINQMIEQTQNQYDQDE